MSPVRPVACPGQLENLSRAFIAEEATSSIRHDVRGKLASVRNGTFYIRRKLEGFPAVLESDPRLPKFFQMIDDELAALGDLLVSRLPLPDLVGSTELDPIAVTRELIGWLQLPAGVSVTLADAQAGRIRANAAELQLAVFCLIENAVDASAAGSDRGVKILISNHLDQLVLTVQDSGPGIADPAQVLTPFFSSKPSQMGAGLKIARRIARRWGGELQVSPSAQGANVSLHFRGVT